jgi:hypothetical protein
VKTPCALLEVLFLHLLKNINISTACLQSNKRHIFVFEVVLMLAGRMLCNWQMAER